MRRLFIAAALLLLGVSTIVAQLSTSSILGTVRDSSGAVVPGAKVTITNTSTNVSRETVTGGDGSYRVDALVPGIYNLTFTKEGFSVESMNALTLDVSQELQANAALKVGSATQTVEIEADTAPQVNVTQSNLGGLVNSQQVADLPLNGRNFIDLALLQPGVANAQYNSPTLLKANYFSTNGAPVRSNLTTLDGAPMINVLGSTSTIAGTTLGVEGIQEFRVITNTPGAQYGIGMGSQITIASKGGSNQFHGSAFDFLRNDDLDAWGYYANAEPKLIRNNFGGSFGGPIKKDKTFVFGTYEAIRQIQGVTTTSNTLSPITGCNYYTGLANAAGVAPVNAAVAAGVANPLSQGANPCSTSAFTYSPNPGVVASTNYNCASGCATTSGAMNPTMAPFIAFYPFPTNYNAATNTCAGGNCQYVVNNNQPTQVDYGQVRVDQTFSASDSMFVRYTTDASSLISPSTFAGTPWKAVGTNGSGSDVWATVAENHVISPSIINVGRISYSRTLNKNLPQYPTALGLSGTPGPYNIVYNQPFGGITQATIASISTPGTSPQGFNQNIYSLSDDVNWNKGKHSIQLGILFNRIEYYLYDAQNIRGSFTFNSTALFMAGSFLQFTMQPPGSNFHREPRFYTYGAYIQDDWRFSPRLTFNLGLRYEINTPVNERTGNNWAFHNLTDPAPINTGTILQDTSYLDFEPRVGFAWDVKGDGKTAVHGGFGVYDDVSAAGQSFYGPSAGTPPTSTQPNILNETINGTFPFITSVWNLTPGTMPYTTAIKTTEYPESQPRIYQYNFSIQRQVTANSSVTLAYAGSKGSNLWDNSDGNPCNPSFVTNGLPTYPVEIQVANNATGKLPIPAGLPAQLEGGSTTQAVQCESVTNPGTASAAFLTANVPTNATYQNATGGTKYIVRNSQNPLWGDWVLAATHGLSNYNAGEFVFSQRVSRGLEGQLAYTFSRVNDEAQGQYSISECSGSGGVPESSLPATRRIVDYGPACFDIHQQLQASVIYHFPKVAGMGFVGKELLSGWWMANKTTWQTGAPFAPTTGSYRSEDGNFTQNSGTQSEYANYGTVTVAPGQTGANGDLNTTASTTFIPYNKKTVYTKIKAHSGTQWFNPLMFTDQELGQLGTVHKAALRGPNYADADISLVKDTALPGLGDKGSLEFRVESFNVFNHSNFAVPGASNYTEYTGAVTSPGMYFEAPKSTAGLSTTTIGNPRQMQLALKLIF